MQTNNPNPNQKDGPEPLFEDEDLIVANKSCGIASDCGRTILFCAMGSLGSFRLRKKVMLAHRLDRCTSGVLMVAKTKPALLELQKQLVLNQVPKRYYALVCGTWPEQWQTKQVVSVPVTKGFGSSAGLIVVSSLGFSASTVFCCLRSWKGFVLLAVTPKTGRTHQIRVHCKIVGLSVVGDEKYGRPNPNQHQMLLHSACLSFRHPHKPKRLTFFAAVPEVFKDFIRNLEPRTEETNT